MLKLFHRKKESRDLEKPRTRNGSTLEWKDRFKICPLESAVKIIAHRGGRSMGPESTLPLYKMALSLNIRVLDVDVWLTKDNKVVVFHDDHLDGDINVKKNGEFIKEKVAIQDLTFDEIREYDVGSLNPSHPTSTLFPEAVSLDNVQIPLLSEVLELIKNGSRYDRVSITIEIKTKSNDFDKTKKLVHLIYECLKAKEILNRVYLQSFDWRALVCFAGLDSGETHLEFLSERTDYFEDYYEKFIEEYKQPLLEYMNKTEITSKVTTLAPADYSLNIISIITWIRDELTLRSDVKNIVWGPQYLEVLKDYNQSVEIAHNNSIPVVVWTVFGGERTDETTAKDVEKLIELGVDGIITESPIKVKTIRAAVNMRRCWNSHRGNHFLRSSPSLMELSTENNEYML